MTERQFKTLIINFVSQFPRVNVSFHQAKKHKYTQLEYGGDKRKVFYSSSPSDHRNAKNQLRDIKAQLVNLGAIKQQPKQL